MGKLTGIYTIPSDWWDFAEMDTFMLPVEGSHYPYDPDCKSDVHVLPLERIEPPLRSEGLVPFKKYKLLPIFFALHSPECALPPISVARIEGPGSYSFRVINGFHRYYASLAVGFRSIAAIVQT